MIGCLSVISCSDDDEKDIVQRPEASVKMQLVFVSDGHDECKDFVYDANGRVVSFTVLKKYDFDSKSGKRTYSYATNKVVCQEDYEDSSKNIIYELTDGLITKSIETYVNNGTSSKHYTVYEYDSSKQLVRVADVDENGNVIWEEALQGYREEHITWENGNPVKITDEEGYTINSFNTQPCYIGPFQDEVTSFFGDEDPYLMQSGFFGVLPVNLLKSVTYYTQYAGVVYDPYTYEITYVLNENGYPLKISSPAVSCSLRWE